MIVGITVLGLVAVVTPTFAATPPVSFSVPDNATAVAPNVFSLGTAYDAEIDGLVEGYAIVHKKAAKAKGGNGGKPATTNCYGVLADGAKWKGTAEDWVMNPSNTYGLDLNSVFNSQVANIAKWESAANYNVLGNGSMTAQELVADWSATDSVNEVYFGSISDPNTIAVTIVWGIFSGPTFSRQLVEWDMIFNSSYDWSLTGEAGKMDFENISTHELGHAMGMADLYNTCTAETMYGYATYGETQKRSLNSGDIKGINTLY